MWLLLIATKASDGVGVPFAARIRNGISDATEISCTIISILKHSVPRDGSWMVRGFGLAGAREMRDEVGQTLRYSAPESLKGERGTEKTFEWYLGMLMYETIAQRPAFEPNLGLEEHLRLVNSGERPPIPSTASAELVRVITSCWEADPSKRMKLGEIVKLLKGAGWKLVKGADEEAVKHFVGLFPLDESATNEEYQAAIAARDQQLAEGTRQRRELEGEVAWQDATIASQEEELAWLGETLAAQAWELAALKAGVPAGTAPGARGQLIQLGTPGTLLHGNSDALVALGVPKASSPQQLLSKGAGPWAIEDFKAVAIGKARTLLLIESEFGVVCGGFAAVPWPSRSYNAEVDATLTSFIFCLGAIPQRFGLLADGRSPVGWWGPGRADGLWFGAIDLEMTCSGTLWVGQQPASYGGPRRNLTRFTGTAKGRAAVARWELWQL
jgi:hypothetical protein